MITPSQEAALHESSNVHVCVWRDQLVAINVPQHMNWLRDAVDSLAFDDSASSFLTSWKHLRHSTAPTRAPDTISHSEEAIIPPTARAGVGGGSFALGLDRRHRGVDMLRHNTAAVHETAHQLFIVARVAPDHGGGRLKDRHGDLL